MTMATNLDQTLGTTTPILSDLVFYDDMSLYATETYDQIQILAQDVYHYLKQRLGSNADLPGVGIGIDDYLNASAAEFNKLPGFIKSQFSRDDRLTGIDCTVVQTGDASLPLLNITLAVNGSVVSLQYGWQNGTFAYLGSG